MKANKNTVKKAQEQREKENAIKILSMKEKRENEKYLSSFQLKGNDKLLDYYDETSGVFYKYAQFNTIAGFCCPFASIGCAIACYAKSGCHVFPSVKKARQKSYNDSLLADFAERMIYTISVELTSKRYFGNHMIIRIHESGDFYSLEYLKKWIEIWKHFQNDSRVTNCFYTKSFKFFLELDDMESEIINHCLDNNVIAMSLSLDDTTTTEQIALAMKVKARFPKANIYYCAENIDEIAYNEKCDCADCARCGNCTKTSGKIVAVKIHSVTEQQKKKYHEKRRDFVKAS